jgi:hypothetical protein
VTTISAEKALIGSSHSWFLANLARRDFHVQTATIQDESVQSGHCGIGFLRIGHVLKNGVRKL